MSALLQLFSSDGYMPHGMCLLWEPALIRLHVLSDALIGLSYFSMPVALVYFARRRSDFELSWLLVLFGIFILACGTTHFFSIWTLWHPDYVLDGLIKAITAVASIPTAILLWTIMPRAMAMPSTGQLSDLNANLRRQIADREHGEEALSEANRKLLETTVELEQSKREAQALSDRLALGTEAGGIGVWDYDIVNGAFWGDERMYELFGMSLDQRKTSYREWLDCVDPADRDGAMQAFDQAIAAGTDYAHEFRIALPVGGSRTLRANGKVSLDDQGRPARMAGISYDVTDLRQRELEVSRRALERFQRVVEAAPSAMVMVNQSGKIEMVNAQAERVFGYDRAALLGQRVEILVPARFRRGHPGLRSTFFAAPQSRPMGAGRDLYGLRKDGSEFPVEIGLNPIETEDGTMVLSAIVDISDRKHKEDRIQAALEEKNILLAEIHHRVKNNLQIVHSLLDLQSTRLTDRAAIDMLVESKNRVNSMALIHQILYQSKDFAEVNFRTVLESLVPALVQSYRLSSSTLRVTIEAENVLLPLNSAIPCGLIVNELTANALKHAFPDQRTGSLRIGLKYAAHDMVSLEITDDGVGISADINFETADTLGVQLVQLLIDQLGGELTINRANPTSFFIRFPQVRRQDKFKLELAPS